jgi:hypothetical protein
MRGGSVPAAPDTGFADAPLEAFWTRAKCLDGAIGTGQKGRVKRSRAQANMSARVESQRAPELSGGAARAVQILRCVPTVDDVLGSVDNPRAGA